jgi:hypothetical protein
MSATPHLTSGRPDGTETISNLQTLFRIYTNQAGQLVRTDAYFNLSGVTYSTSPYIGTQNTNYYTTEYGYDDRGWKDRVQLPTGTIERTVRDGLSRVVSLWVGTNAGLARLTGDYLFSGKLLTLALGPWPNRDLPQPHWIIPTRFRG